MFFCRQPTSPVQSMYLTHCWLARNFPVPISDATFSEVHFWFPRLDLGPFNECQCLHFLLVDTLHSAAPFDSGISVEIPSRNSCIFSRPPPLENLQSGVQDNNRARSHR